MRQLGEVLLEQGLITQQQLDESVDEQQRLGKSLGRILIDKSLVTERDLVSALAKQIGMDFVDLSDFDIDASASALISDTIAKRYNALPIGYQDGRLVVAMSDPA